MIGNNPGIQTIHKILKDVHDVEGSGLDVFIQSNTNTPFQYWLINETITDRVLTVGQPAKVNVLPLDDVTGIIPGDLLAIFEGTLYEQVKIISINASTVIIDQNTSFSFSTAASIVIGKNNIAANTGTLATPVIYQYNPRDSVVPVDMSYLVITIESGNSAPDDSLFGGIAALENGLYMYRDTPTGRLNLGAYHTNADFKDRGALVKYEERLIGGIYSTFIIFETAKIFDDVIRLDTAIEKICLETRDVQTGNTNITASILGSFTIGE